MTRAKLGALLSAFSRSASIIDSETHAAPGFRQHAEDVLHTKSIDYDNASYQDTVQEPRPGQVASSYRIK